LTALEVNELLVECGPRWRPLSCARARRRAVLYVAPTFLGADAAPLAQLRRFAASTISGFEFPTCGASAPTCGSF
jgi:riboflavin biosynthesis pyrimidine reductase